MRERARVEHDRAAPTACGVNGVGQRAFVVRLHMLDFVSELGGGLASDRDEVVERRGAVEMRLPLGEQVQVRSREQQDGCHGGFASTSTAAKAFRTAVMSGSSTRSI